MSIADWFRRERLWARAARRSTGFVGPLLLLMALLYLHRDNVVSLTPLGAAVRNGVAWLLARLALVAVTLAIWSRRIELFATWPLPLRWPIRACMALLAALFAAVFGYRGADIAFDLAAMRSGSLDATLLSLEARHARRHGTERFATVRIAETGDHVRLRLDTGFVRRVALEADERSPGQPVAIRARRSAFGVFADAIEPPQPSGTWSPQR